ncbi:MAG: DUF2490 domain-containing protein [Bacteroidales bacterium]
MTPTKSTMMTRMMNKKLLLFVALIGCLSPGYSQKKDFGIWYEVSAGHKLIKKLDLDLSGTVRTFDNASKIDEAYLEAGLMYKFNKYFAAGAHYRISESPEDDNSYHLRHKWFIDARGTLPAGDITLTGRVRFQERFKTYIGDENDAIPDFHIRFKFIALYDIPSFPVNPYIGAEIFSPVFSDASRTIDKNRFMAGVKFNISKNHSVELGYLFQRDFLPHISDINVIRLGYGLRF